MPRVKKKENHYKKDVAQFRGKEPGNSPYAPDEYGLLGLETRSELRKSSVFWV